MKIKEIVKILNAGVLTGEDELELDVRTACGSDLMSDVMAYAGNKDILLTGLVNPQVIRTAEMIDIKVVIFVRGKKPGDSIIEMAREKGIILLTTDYPMFIACGKLYSEGICGGDG